ncbi:vexin [Bombina bombina]|uniref:vexin n=1 Tax=Bombina bombina TaxID=8345 RepID=UPI00235B26E4|nr:vexin [Bombina bombina]
MNKIQRYSDGTLQTFSTSNVCCSPRTGIQRTQRAMTNNVLAASDFHSHWPKRFDSHQADVVQVIYRGDDVWRQQPQDHFPLQCSAKYIAISDKKTKKCKKNKQSKKPKNKSLPSTSVQSKAQQIAPTMSPSHVTSVKVGCNKQKFQNTEEELTFGTEASLPLTGIKISKRAPSLWQKLGMRLKKTVEYIGASNCAFEED